MQIIGDDRGNEGKNTGGIEGMGGAFRYVHACAMIFSFAKVKLVLRNTGQKIEGILQVSPSPHALL